GDAASLNLRSNAMLDRVFDNRLQNHAGYEAAEGRSVNLLFDSQLVLAKANLFDIEIIIDELQDLPQRDEVFMPLQQFPQDVREFYDHRSRFGRVGPDQR